MFFLVLLISALPVFADDRATFTTVFYDDFGIVYAGLSKGSLVKVVTFPLAQPQEKKFYPTAPESFKDKRIVGFLPDKDKFFLVAITQKGDTDPELYMHKKDKWKRIGTTHCENFTKAKLLRHKLTFFCEELNKKKKVVIKSRTISLGREKLFRSGVFRFPEFLLRYKNVMLVLEGRAPDWSRLRIKQEQETDEIVLEAEEVWNQG
jgi:hypothetical protein